MPGDSNGLQKLQAPTPMSSFQFLKIHENEQCHYNRPSFEKQAMSSLSFCNSFKVSPALDADATNYQDCNSTSVAPYARYGDATVFDDGSLMNSGVRNNNTRKVCDREQLSVLDVTQESHYPTDLRRHSDTSMVVVVNAKNYSEIREQDRLLPINNVSKIMKSAIASYGKISLDAKVSMQECASEFISFVCSEAAERCFSERRRIMNGDDIINALHALGFSNYATVAKIYLQTIRKAFRDGFQYKTTQSDSTPTT